MFAATRAQLRDKELRRKLTPDCAIGCKRIRLSANYLPALSKDYVDDAIIEIAPSRVVWVVSEGEWNQNPTLIHRAALQLR